MTITLSTHLRRICTIAFAVIAAIIAPATCIAQDKSSEKETEQTQASEEEKDPFAVPEYTSDEDLFKFMDAVLRIAPPSRDRDAITEHAKKVFPAIIAAADVVLAKSDSEESQIKAIQKQFQAYGIFTRYDRSAQKQLDALVEKCSEDERPEIAALGLGHKLSAKASSLMSASKEDAEESVGELLAFLDDYGVSKTTFGPAASFASALGRSKNTELAASLYEQLAERCGTSEEASLRKYGEKMAGSARRLRLLGNEMELSGLIADGAEFAWSDYKGKVVLVDFWASWCGPCMGEIPNMKKNLDLYGDKGFEIVGINMDSTRAAYEKCVESRDITWVNIVSDEKGKTGWDAPMATHYGITGIPTAILVNQKGKVVSLRARGRELDDQLAELLGPIEEPETANSVKADDSQDEDAPEDK